MLPTNSLIPIHDENPTSTFSYLTVALLVLNLVGFAMEPGLALTQSPELIEFFYRWGLVPWEITNGRPVGEAEMRVAAIGISCQGLCIPDKNVYLALLTSMFLHGNFLHIGGNMLFLWVFGNNIEDTAGRVRFVIFYLVTGLAASMAHVLANSQSVIPTIGASGAVSGLLGAYIILFPRARVTSILPLFFYWTTVKLPAFVVLGIWFLSQFLIAAQQPAGGGSGVAWMAHVGGFVAGAILIFLFGGRPRRPQPVTQYW
ncbi:MAG: rhomboid family intramembrane serine protease [Actinomycetota bacterium]